MEEIKYWTPDQEFVQVRVPDKMNIAALLNKAKGDRTMAQLAEACGVSASTLSRAVNGKITKPLTVELIKAIADNSVVGDEGFFEQLMRANGMRLKEDAERMERSQMRPMEQRREMEIIAKNVISSELLRRGVPLKFVSRTSSRWDIQSDYWLRWTGSFAFEIETEDEKYLWNLLVFPYRFDPDERRMPPRYLMQRLMDNVSGWFLIDAWEPEKFEDIKNTIVFMDSVFYDMYIDNILGAKLNGDFSIMLVGTEDETVHGEIMMPKKNGESKTTLFALPVIDDTGDGDDPWGRPDYF